MIQAFFFADGGLLALGTNIFNLGVFPCFLGLPLFRLIAGKQPLLRAPDGGRDRRGGRRPRAGGDGRRPRDPALRPQRAGPGPFVALMAGIHLPIGIIEGFVTAAVLGYVLKIRPELAAQALGTVPEPAGPPRSLAPVLGVVRGRRPARRRHSRLVRLLAPGRAGVEHRARDGKQDDRRPEHGLAGSLRSSSRRPPSSPNTRCRQRCRRAGTAGNRRGRRSTAGNPSPVSSGRSSRSPSRGCSGSCSRDAGKARPHIERCHGAHRYL